jgi:isocitrate dehydrogenase
MMNSAGDIMTSPAVAIDASATVAEALDTMRDHGISSILVRPAGPGAAWGIVTKRDILVKVVVRDLDPEGLRVGEIMKAPLITIRAHWGLEEISALMAAAGIRRVAVVRGDEVLGIVSDTDIFTALEAQDWSAARATRKARARRRAASGTEATVVSDLMSSPVLTTSPDATVRECMRHMLDHGVSSLLVETGAPHHHGIITKRDIVTKVVGKGKDRGLVRVRDVLSAPLRTVAAETSIQECSARMANENLRRLPVTKDGAIVGIISDTDIFAAVEARRWRGRRRRRPTLHTVADVMNRPPRSIEAGASVAYAMAVMKEADASTLLVAPAVPSGVWGLVTRRDIVDRVLARNRDPKATTVGTIMTSPLIMVSPETSLWECTAQMAGSGMSLVSVVQGGSIIGVVSDTDIFMAIEERGWGVD